MREEFKPLIYFFIRLVLFSALLVGSYHYYLQYYSCAECDKSDPFTELVANQTGYILNNMGYDATVKQDPLNPQLGIFINNDLVSVVNEGCNSATIMIIFLGFVIGFYSGFIKTLIFSVLGLFLIHIANVIRVVWLNYIYFLYPEFSQIAHDYISPIIIYGMVVLFWLFWLQRFALPYWKKLRVYE